LWLAVVAMLALIHQSVCTADSTPARAAPMDMASAPTELASAHVLRVGWFERGKSFLDYENEYGIHQGLNPDYLHHIAAPQGVALTYRYYDTIPAMMAALERGDIDVVPSMLDDSSRAAHFWVSPTYSTQQVGLAMRLGSPKVQTIQALDGERIACETGSISRQRLTALLPHAQFVDVDSAHDGIAAVAEGRADVYVGLQTLNLATIAQHGLGTLRSDPLPGVNIDLHFLTRRDDAASIAVIQHGLASLSASERATLEANWLTSLPTLPNAPIAPASPAQLQWLRDHATLKIGIYSFQEPYDFLDDTNRWRGIGASILSAFAIARHVRLEPILLNALDDPLDALRSGEVDVIASVPIEHIALEQAAVTRPYDSVPWVLLESADAKHMPAHIAAQEWRVSHLSPVPKLSPDQIVNYVTSDDALEALIKGEVDAAYVNLVAANRVTAELKSGRLTVDKTFSATEQIGFAVAAGNLPLQTLLNDFIGAYSRGQLQDLARRNHPTPVSIGYNLTTVLKVALPVLFVSASLFGILLWAYRRVQRASLLAARAQADAEDARVRAEQADLAKSRFLATMSHEIRTPLSGIVGVVDVLQTTPLSADQRHYLELAHQSAKLLMGIINDVLDFSKIEAGKLSIDAAPVDLYRLAGHLSGLYQPLARAKGIGFFVSIMPHFERLALIDEMRVLQILTNLLGNAIRFTDTGYVHVKLSCRYRHGQPMLAISVTDTGIGMPAEFQAHLFEPFVQADGSATRRVGGSGLGLSIVKRLLDLMHGAIAIDSRLGVGTRVDVVVPIHWERTEDSSTQAQASLPYGGMQYRLALRSTALRPALVAWLHRLGAKPGEDPEDAEIQIVERDPGCLFLCRKSLADMPLVCSHALLDSLAQTAQPRPPDAPTDKHAPPCVGRLLVAEDNDINRDIIVQLLSTLDVSAETAIDGIDALEQWHRSPPDIMLVDCQMPRMDGYELVRQIRQAESGSGRHTVVIAITANASLEDERLCLAAGMDDFLSKPLTRQKLNDILRKWTEVASDSVSAH